MRNLIAIYSNADSDRFDVGEVVYENDEELLLTSYSNKGEFDGYIYLFKENIYRYESDSKYLKRIEMIIDFKDKQGALEVYDYKNKDNILNSIFDIIKIESLFVTLTVLDSEKEQIVGTIKSSDEQFVEIIQYNFYGEYDGISKIEKVAVIRMDIDGSDEKLIKKLVAHHQ